MFEFITGSLPVLFLTACIAAVLLGIERADREVVYEQTNNIPWGLSAVRVLLLLFVLNLFFCLSTGFSGYPIDRGMEVPDHGASRFPHAAG